MPTRAERRQAELAARQQQTQLVAQLTATSMSGPLPAPNLLEEYERISPGAAGIIIGEFQLRRSIGEPKSRGSSFPTSCGRTLGKPSDAH